MIREDYIGYLERRNGYCECPSVADLVATRKNVEKLEAKCRLFDDGVDIREPKDEDEAFLRKYLASAEELRDGVRDYRQVLGEYAHDGRVKLKLHTLNGHDRVTDVSLSEAVEIQRSDKLAILTAHCGKCGQQIDVI